MDWAKLIVAQSETEKQIKKVKHFDEDKLGEQKLVGALLELSELANTFAAFKYWKKSHVTNQAKLIDECADSLTTLLALANHLKLTKLPEANIASEEISSQTLAIFNAVIGLQYAFTKVQLSKAIALYRGLLAQLQIDEAVIEKAFFARLKTYDAFLKSQDGYGL